MSLYNLHTSLLGVSRCISTATVTIYGTSSFHYDAVMKRTLNVAQLRVYLSVHSVGKVGIGKLSIYRENEWASSHYLLNM